MFAICSVTLKCKESTAQSFLDHVHVLFKNCTGYIYQHLCSVTFARFHLMQIVTVKSLVGPEMFPKTVLRKSWSPGVECSIDGKT